LNPWKEPIALEVESEPIVPEPTLTEPETPPVDGADDKTDLIRTELEFPIPLWTLAPLHGAAARHCMEQPLA